MEHVNYDADFERAIEESISEEFKREKPSIENLKAQIADLHNSLTETEISNNLAGITISEQTSEIKNKDDTIASLKIDNEIVNLENLSLRLENLRLQKQILYLQKQLVEGEIGQMLPSNPFSFSEDLSSF